MKLFGRELSGYARLLVILAAVLLVASGLCGLQLAMGGNPMGSNSAGPLAAIFFIAGLLELIAFWISAAGIVIVSAVWLVTAISNALYDRFGKPPKDNTQHLFDNRNETDRDNPQ